MPKHDPQMEFKPIGIIRPGPSHELNDAARMLREQRCRDGVDFVAVSENGEFIIPPDWMHKVAS